MRNSRIVLGFVVLATLTFSASIATAQSRAEARKARAADSTAVHRAVLDYVEGFYEGDSVKLMRSVRPEVAKGGFSRPADATDYQYRVMPFPAFLSYARGVKERNSQAPASAPKKIKIFDVLDQTASAKLTASWGTDYLLLGRYDGKWMITHVLWQSAPRAANTR